MTGLLFDILGADLEGKLTIERFLDFQMLLQREILTLEFDRKEPTTERRITERQFAELLLAYANYSTKKRAAILKRVKKAYRGAIHQLLSIILKLRILVLLPVLTMPYVVIVLRYYS
jgi:hypothetical protein